MSEAWRRSGLLRAKFDTSVRVASSRSRDDVRAMRSSTPCVNALSPFSTTPVPFCGTKFTALLYETACQLLGTDTSRIPPCTVRYSATKAEERDRPRI